MLDVTVEGPLDASGRVADRSALDALVARQVIDRVDHKNLNADVPELAGAVPTTVQAAEVSQAFATNLVSAMLTSSSTGVSSKAWEFSKYYYDTNAWHPRNVMSLISSRLPSSSNARPAGLR